MHRSAVLVLALVGHACQAADERQPPPERVLSFAEIGFESLDPNLIAETAGSRIGEELFEPLVTAAPGDSPAVPGQATHWDVTEGGAVYTFHLRRDAVWSDGTPITSADHLYAWERGLNPATRSRNAQQLWVIQGAKEYNAGETRDFATVGATALDPYTLRVRLVAPAPYFLDVLAQVPFAPVPRHVIERWGDQWTQPEHIVGNGPFVLTERKARDRVTLVKNPRYWDAGNVWLDKVIAYDVENDSVAFRWYERGKIQWTPSTVPLEKTEPLIRSGRTDYHIDPILSVYYYVFNTRRAPFDDVRVRRAFNMAIDKGRLTRQVMGAGQRPATHMVPPGFKAIRGYDGLEGDPFDPDRARRLLAEAGYGPGGKPFPSVRLLYNTHEAHRVVAEYVQSSLRTNLGVDIAIDNMEWKTLLVTMLRGEYDLSRSGWQADFPDPQNFLDVLSGQSENNYPQWDCPEYDAVIDELRRTGPQARRNELTRRAEALINRDTPILPIYFYTKSYMLREYVRGIEPQIQDQHLLRYVSFEGAVP